MKSVNHGLRRRVLCCLALVSVMVVTSCRLPSDSELRASYRKHRAELQQLADMFAADQNLVRVAPGFVWRIDDFSWPRPVEKLGISVDRWEDYRRRFRAAGVHDGIGRGSSEYSSCTFLIVDTTGALLRGHTKGFAVCTTVPARLELSTELLPANLKKGETVFKPLEGNWYLFID